MSRNPAEPERLLDLPPEQDLVGVSALMRAAATPLKAIAPASRQRIRGRLYRSLAGRSQALQHRWRQALVLACALAVGGVVGATTHSVIIKRWSPKEGLEPKQARETPGPRRASLRPAQSTPTAVDNKPQPVQLLGPPPAASPAEPPHAATPPVEALPARALPRPPALASRSALPRALPAASSSPRVSALLAGSSSPPAAMPSVRTLPAEALPPSPALASRSAVPHPLAAVSSSPRVSTSFAGNLSPPAAQADGIRPPVEAAVLAQAIRKLRVDGDASAALRLLDERRAGYPGSALSPEVSALRIEALLKLGQTDAALSELDRLPLRTMPRRDEWQVLRGELHARAGHWSSAEADFTMVLSSRLSTGGDLAERACWGRAVARSHQGNDAGARADASEYLRRFPGGRFASQASQTLLGASPR
jgi:hypothetical protein